MSCCFISFVTCPEIVGIETALHFSDCSSRSCGHRNAASLPRLLPLLSVSPSISHSSLLSFPHLCAYPSYSRSLCPEAMTPALLGNLWLTLRPFFSVFFFIPRKPSLFPPFPLLSSFQHSTRSWGLASISQTSGGCSAWLKREVQDRPSVVLKWVVMTHIIHLQQALHISDLHVHLHSMALSPV